MAAENPEVVAIIEEYLKKAHRIVPLAACSRQVGRLLVAAFFIVAALFLAVGQ